MTTAQDGGKFVSLTHWPLLPPRKILLVLISVTGWVDPTAIVRSEGFYVNEKSNDTSWDRTSDLPICSTAPSPLCYRGPQFILSIFINLYMFRTTMCLSSGETTVFMWHFVLVIPCGWLSGVQEHICSCIPACNIGQVMRMCYFLASCQNAPADRFGDFSRKCQCL